MSCDFKRQSSLRRDDLQGILTNPNHTYLEAILTPISKGIKLDQTEQISPSRPFSALDQAQLAIHFSLGSSTPPLISVPPLWGCWISDPCNFYLGRRGAIFLAAIFCFLPVIGSAFAQSWPELFVCRLLLGFGMGMKGSTIPIYAAENSPATIRGALVMTWQL